MRRAARQAPTRVAAQVRLQLQNELGTTSGEAKPYRGFLGTASDVFRREGVPGLYRGLGAAVIRQAVYGGIGLGTYQPVRNLITGPGVENPPLVNKMLAGAITGAFGNAVATPCDVVRVSLVISAACAPPTSPPQVKVRLQADGRLEQPRYRGTVDAFLKIPREEGFGGLYRGIGPTVQRAAIINGTGIAAYDHTKHLLLTQSALGDTSATHAIASAVSGFLSAVVSAPLDVLKTRIMNQHRDRPLYQGMLDCAVKTVRAEGPRAMLKGFFPAWMRLGPWQLVFFLSYEQTSRLVHGHTFQTTTARDR